MSKKQNKQRMKLRLLAAIGHHHPDPLEFAVMRDEYMRMTHKELKEKLRMVSAWRSGQEVAYLKKIPDGAGGYVLVTPTTDKKKPARWRAMKQAMGSWR